MISQNLERLVDHVAAALRKELPEAAHLSTFQLQTYALDAIRAHGNKLADELIGVHLLTKQLEALSALAQM